MLLAVDLQVVASTVEALQPHLRGNASQNTVGDDGDTLAEDISFFHRVSCQDDGSLSLESSKNVPKLSATLWVQSSRRLIKIDDLWVRDQSDGHRKSSLHTSRKGFGFEICSWCELYIFKCLLDKLFFFMWWNTFDSSIENKMFSDSHIFPKDIKLWAVTNLKLNSLKLMLDIESSNPCISFCWRIETCQHRDQSSLTSTVWSQETKHFTFFNSKSKVFRGYFFLSSTTPRVNFPNIFDNERVLVVISLVQVINYISLSFGISILKAGLIVIDWNIVGLSIFLKIPNLIVIVSDALSTGPPSYFSSIFVAKPIPFLRDSVALRHDLVQIPS